MGLPIVKNRATGANVARAIPSEGIYDTEIQKTGAAVQQIVFYTNPLGQPDASAVITRKTYGETNLLQSSQLPKGYRFQLHGINFKFFANTAAATGVSLTDADIQLILVGGWIEVSISQIVICRKVLYDTPFGVAPIKYGTTTADTHNVNNLGVEHVSNVIRTQVKGQHPTIESGESFSATVNWPAAPAIAISTRMVMMLHGILFKPI